MLISGLAYTLCVDAKNVFSLQYADGNVSFVCASAPEKRRWVREVRAQVNEQLKKDMKQKALGDSGGRTSTPMRLTGSLRSSTVDISRRDSNVPEPARAVTTRGEPERKGSIMGMASETAPERRGSGGSTSMKAPMGLLRKDRGTE